MCMESEFDGKFPCPHCGGIIDLEADEELTPAEKLDIAVESAEVEFERATIGIADADRDRIATSAERLRKLSALVGEREIQVLANEVILIVQRVWIILDRDSKECLSANLRKIIT